MPELEISLGDAEAEFGANRRTMTKALKDGRLKGRKVADVWVVRPSAVRHWLATGNHARGTPPGKPRRRKEPAGGQ
jgi:hypothetical protein